MRALDRDLAIVVPIFKQAFLRETLDSIHLQTCKDFRLYLVNDGSPENIDAVISGHAVNQYASYIRFDDNVGSESPVKHWKRALEVVGEEWILVFGDDDKLPQDAVERFYRVLDETAAGFDIYRFPLVIIDSGSVPIYFQEALPVFQSAFEYIQSRLHGKTISSVNEYVFRRSVYCRVGGFEDFPLAWCSDDATWFKIGAQRGIRSVPGAPVMWRTSNKSISGSKKNYRNKAIASLQFLCFLKQRGFKDDAQFFFWYKHQLSLFPRDWRIIYAFSALALEAKRRQGIFSGLSGFSLVLNLFLKPTLIRRN